MVLATVFLVFVTIFYSRVKDFCAVGFGKFLKYLFVFGLVCLLGFSAFLYAKAKTSADGSEKAVIVLGCGLNRDGTPSGTLQKRLDGCIDYAKTNPDAYIVVTGGKAKNRDITEALAMKNYLVANGIDPDKIICEDKAVSTKENFVFAKEILQEKGIEPTDIAYITNSFHAYRSGEYAKLAGFKNVKAVSVATDPVVIIPATVREILAVTALWIFEK